MKFFLTHLVSLSFIIAFPAAFPETLEEYTDACKKELGISKIPQFSCKSVQFRERFNNAYLGLDFSQSDDFVGHKRIDDSTDAVFACRWVGVNASRSRAVSGEMIVHNRRTGGTCFFELMDLNEDRTYPQVDFDPPSPTESNAALFWSTPTNTSTCTNCHAAGPYIASPQIVGALAKFGLINDGHDTLNKKYYAVGSSGSQFADRLNNKILNVSQPSCARGCHVIGGNPTVPSRIGAGFVFGSVVLPSINHVIDDIALTGAMPPTNQHSDYRWLNRDDPGGTGDYERLSDFEADKQDGKNDFSKLYCDNPSFIQVRRVGSSIVLNSKSFSYVRAFNLQDGLVCNNSDFPDNHPYKCFDYQTSYKCDGEWTKWYDRDDPSGSMDNEARPLLEGLCENPTDIKARYKAPVAGEPWMGPYYGPRDRFKQFDNKGLLCKNEDQDDGKCSNYSVRFMCN